MKNLNTLRNKLYAILGQLTSRDEPLYSMSGAEPGLKTMASIVQAFVDNNPNHHMAEEMSDWLSECKFHFADENKKVR